MKKLLLALLIVFAGLTVSAQCSMVPVSLAQRTSASDLIIEGKVTGQRSFWNSYHNMIYTASTVEVYKIFKGTLAATSIEILSEGGTVGLDKITVEPSLQIGIGETGIFTCETVKHVKGNVVSRGGLPQYEAYASAQGFIRYNIDNQTAADPFNVYTDIDNQVYSVVNPSGSYQEIRPFNFHSTQHINPNFAAVSISGFSPTTITAGTGTTITITGSGFGSTQGAGTVGFKNADDGGATYITPLASQYLSWSNTQIVVEVPSGAGTGTIQVTQGSTTTSSSTLTVSYAHLNVEFDPGSGTIAYQTDHIDDNGSGGYTWQMNPGFDGNASAKAAFLRAFDSWRCTTGINWTIGANTSINDAVSDGTNVICFDNTSPLSAGILGVCYSYWSGCASGPNIVWYVNELDIIFDEGSNISPLTWQYGPSLPSGSEYDFESVAVHELGHGHQLGHVIAPGQIMHYSLANGTSNRSLSANDISGANYVQSKSIVANICGPGAMVNYTCGAAPVAAFSGSPTTLCAGGSVSFTDQSTNSPTSWSWTFQGGTPSSSTSQNPTITYNTPGTYSVSLTATNASGNNTHSVTGYITVNATPSGSISSTNITCNGAGNGTATATITGGSTPYNYNWAPGNPTGDGTNAVTGLSTGTYTVLVTDANNCLVAPTVTITEPSAISFSAASQTNVSCNSGSNGAASVNAATGGTGSFTYNWTPGNPTGDGTTSVTGLSAGTYTCTASDANGCTATATFNITAPSAISTSASSTPSSCTASTGSATVLASGGAGSFTYSWAPSGGTAAIATSLAAGTYTCTVTDANSCTATQTVAVATASGPSASVSAQSNVTCNSLCDGSATVSASGGTAPYAYSWSPSGGTTATASNLCAGSYTCTVTDANSCVVTATVNITQPSTLTVTMSKTDATCANNDGTATATPSGGTAPYSYSWSPGGQTTQTINGIAGGTYTCTIVDNNGCTTTGTITVNTGGCGPTQLASGSCGITMSTLTQLLTCNPVANATNYRYRLICTAQGYNQVFVRGSNSNNFSLVNHATGIQYGRTYTVEVAAYVGGSWSDYGNICTVTTPATIPVTQLASGSCGVTMATLDQILLCNSVPGATNYRYHIVCAAQGYDQTVVRNSSLNNFSLTNHATGIEYNRTYTIEVAANVSGVWGAYGSACTVTTPATIPATQLTATYCGSTLTALTQTISCNAVAGAINYRYHIVCAAQGYDQTFLRNSSQNNFSLVNHATGIQYGQTYSIEVAAYANNTWGPYGNVCTVTTPASIPLTQLASGSCGATLSTMGQLLNCVSVAGATNYRYHIVCAAQGYDQTFLRNSAQTNFSLVNHATGIQYARTYSIEVAAYVSGVWGAYGTVCSVTTPSAPPIAQRNTENVPSVERTAPEATDALTLDVFPNPFNENLTVVTNGNVHEIYVMNVYGALVKTVSVTEARTEISFADLPAGMYIIEARTEDGVITKRVIKQ